MCVCLDVRVCGCGCVQPAASTSAGFQSAGTLRSTVLQSLLALWFSSGCKRGQRKAVLQSCTTAACAHCLLPGHVVCPPQNVLHGDLNGNNILLAGAHVNPGAADQRGFTAKVADFGLSRLLSPGGCRCCCCCVL